MHSFIYAKEKGHNTVWLPTGEAMYEIEGSEATAAMYATRWDLEAKPIEDLKQDENGAYTNIEFDKVGPYWTALNKIKGIKLELSQPEWSTVPLIKADISGVETGAIILFNKEVPNFLYEQGMPNKPQVTTQKTIVRKDLYNICLVIICKKLGLVVKPKKCVENLML